MKRKYTSLRATWRLLNLSAGFGPNFFFVTKVAESWTGNNCKTHCLKILAINNTVSVWFLNICYFLMASRAVGWKKTYNAVLDHGSKYLYWLFVLAETLGSHGNLLGIYPTKWRAGWSTFQLEHMAIQQVGGHKNGCPIGMPTDSLERTTGSSTCPVWASVM